MSKLLLSIKEVTIQFGGLKAVDNVSIDVQQGEIRAIIGPNGAGKTTLLNAITGFYRPTAGKIIFEGEDLTGKDSYYIASRGIARTFQNPRLFKGLTVLDNVLIGSHNHLKQTALDAIMYARRFLTEEKSAREKASEYLAMVGLTGKEDIKARNLPYGQQKLLEIARALAQQPRMLLLDEPAAGLNPTETINLNRLLLGLRALGLTIILIEHNMQVVMNIADRITVLNFGRKIAEGNPEEIRANNEVIEAYLGKKRGQTYA